MFLKLLTIHSFKPSVIRLLFKPIACKQLSTKMSGTDGDGLKKSLLWERSTEMMKRRKILDERKTKINEAHISVLTDGSQASHRSVLLTSGGRSYLFNGPSGVQRLAQTYRTKLTELRHVFLTQFTCDNISGLYGLSLCAQELGIPSICLHSTKNSSKFFKPLEKFVSFNTPLELLVKEYPPGMFEDDNLRAEPIVIHDQEPSNSKLQPLIAYLCQLPDTEGKLDVLKCRELKVPLGPLLAKLKSGRDITLPNGTEIKSSQVCLPKQPGSKFLVIECPSPDYIDSITKSQVMNQVIKHEQTRPIDFVLHLTYPEVYSSQKYQDWLNLFQDSSCRHFAILGNKHDRVLHLDFIRNRYLLNQVDEQLFPPPCFEPDFQKNIEQEILKENEKQKEGRDSQNEEKNISPPVPVFNSGSVSSLERDRFKLMVSMSDLDQTTELGVLDKISMKPNTGFLQLKSDLDLAATYREACENKLFLPKLEEYREKVKTLPEANDHEPEIVFLGTGSAIPNKYRNLSSILINFSQPNEVSIMMDSGEDTYGQLVRYRGQQVADSILKKLKLIYVSHHHADHHLGLTQLLYKKSQLTDEPTIVLCPPHVIDLVQFYNQNIAQTDLKYKLYRTELMRNDSIQHMASDMKNQLYEDMSGFLEHLDLIRVDHCPNSCAVVMRFKIGHPQMDTYSISYSGDCRPSPDFMRAARDCDLLIHEATFNKTNLVDAIVKKHTTQEEALEISRKMRAKFTILTHFSQRMPKIPIFTREFDENIGFAMDHMRVRCPSDFARLYHIRDTLTAAYSIDLIKHQQLLDDFVNEDFVIENSRNLFSQVD